MKYEDFTDKELLEEVMDYINLYVFLSRGGPRERLALSGKDCFLEVVKRQKLKEDKKSDEKAEDNFKSGMQQKKEEGSNGTSSYVDIKINDTVRNNPQGELVMLNNFGRPIISVFRDLSNADSFSEEEAKSIIADFKKSGILMSCIEYKFMVLYHNNIECILKNDRLLEKDSPNKQKTEKVYLVTINNENYNSHTNNLIKNEILGLFRNLNDAHGFVEAILDREKSPYIRKNNYMITPMVLK